MGSSNKKFLAPAAVSAGEFAGNVYRLTEEFRQGKGEKKKKKGTNHTRAPRHSPAVSKCKIKKKKKKQFPNCSGTPTPSPGKKKKVGGKCLELPISARESLPTHCYSWAQEIA